MITEREIESVNLSPTKKDFYQMWNEIINMAIELSPVWQPDNTNESDPGIVLMKLLVSAADKLNYNIDKNILEAFLPSATQEESVRKLCELVGYTPKYYRSATTDVTISFIEANNLTMEGDFGSGIYFPKYVNIKDEDDLINYVTLEEFTLSTTESARKISCIEGELAEVETNNDNIVSTSYLDDNNRYLLPEANIAENGIFITNISDDSESDTWIKVNILSSQALGTKIFKVGYDSDKNLPYIQFPEDIDQLIEDGLRIRYIRTNASSGNIAAKRLSKIEIPGLWSTADEDSPIRQLTADNFAAVNISASINGAEKETINEAYNSFKKTIGTFDTLVTCRDYMNKIYTETFSDTNTTPLVSNVIVSDIRDDLNKAVTLCSFNDYGICYKNVSLKSNNKDLISHFDLILYPFKTIYGLGTQEEYDNSFVPTTENGYLIEEQIAKNKCISHEIKYCGSSDIACIKNYLKLNAKITTIKKVTLAEEATILAKIYLAIYENFNMRKLDFGVAIPEDTIKSVIKNASAMIKEVEWKSPEMYTVFVTGNGEEIKLTSYAESGALTSADTIYNKLVVRNVLAGRIAAFQYETIALDGFEYSKCKGYNDKYPDQKDAEIGHSFHIHNLTSEFKLPKGKVPYKLQDNEVIQFRTRNFKTTKTYPAYVNYYFIKDTKEGSGNYSVNPIPATFIPLADFFNKSSGTFGKSNDTLTLWNYIGKCQTSWFKEIEVIGTKNSNNFNDQLKKNGKIFNKNDDETYSTVDTFDKLKSTSEGEKQNIRIGYVIDLENYYTSIYNFICSLTYTYSPDNQEEKKITSNYLGIYRRVAADASRAVGKMVDISKYKYYISGTYQSSDTPWNNHFVQDVNDNTSGAGESVESRHTFDGLGRDGVFAGVPANTEYQLQPGEYLLINYTSSSTSSEDATTTESVNDITYGPGDIIRPNFKLVDSSLYHESHSWQKTSGYTFDKDIGGMFSLGTNEQIEIRDFVKVVLRGKITNIYWERNDEKLNATSVEFTFDENNGTEYTLKDGEYFYYTDEKKLDMSYYGAGTIIKKCPNTPKLVKYTSGNTVSIEDVITYGNIADLNWVQVNLAGPTIEEEAEKEQKALILYENQYINLTAGDKINSIDINEKDYLTNEYVTVNSATYTYNGEDEEQSLPTISVGDMKWSVRSRLDFNLGPSIIQTLHEYDSITTDTYEQFYDENDVYQAKKAVGKNKTFKYEDGKYTEGNEICLNSNYLCQLASSTISVKVEGYDENGNYDEHLNNFIIRPYNYTPIEDVTGSNVPLDNYSSKYTKYSFTSIQGDNQEKATEDGAFSVSVHIPDDCEYGLLMVNYNRGDANNTSSTIPQSDASIECDQKILRFNDGTDRSENFKKELRVGINIFKIPKDATKITFYADEDFKSIIVFSHIKNVKGINPKLDYHGDLDKLLSDIKNTGYGDKFYYSVDIENDNKIDINSNIVDEKLSSPEIWYDQNNINNKFVISEIDSTHLPIGITLTNSSRRS